MSRPYLLLYNLVSLAAWTHLTARALRTAATATTGGTVAAEHLVPHITALQTAALVEVAHAALGLVRVSPATTALQVGGRNLVVWTVARRFPALLLVAGARGRAAFLGCLLAWGCSDVLRYAFFAAAAASRSGRAPGWLKWLRYTAFIPLYPIGFLSEASLVYLALVEGEGVGVLYRVYLFVGLLAYIPASYILYTYMLSQRRRALQPAVHAKTT
ncbi:PTPLA-domain-containing protein [Xylaria palmicola]|nr:PTPLA-domain-containing protein [Xylaria palmicola]